MKIVAHQGEEIVCHDFTTDEPQFWLNQAAISAIAMKFVATNSNRSIR